MSALGFNPLQCPMCKKTLEVSHRISCCSLMVHESNATDGIIKWNELVLRYREVIALEEISRNHKEN